MSMSHAVTSSVTFMDRSFRCASWCDFQDTCASLTGAR
ncbi:hypothetical protein KGG73_gp24 [Streptomyces phage Sentinel]|uniref:Uncharacterized protein n=1 Tax=Streptomyces phage Sentinel TaxID=2767584 RepID=A0A873WI53_9CAUD|nr:hypothetical protein KGG73_gp24 [Streptomyces phage Sentinel]QPB09858.1 hypothetical protein CPT_Sentinel_024 [Streptomyces phage Sentinel]